MASAPPNQPAVELEVDALLTAAGLTPRRVRTGLQTNRAPQRSAPKSAPAPQSHTASTVVCGQVSPLRANVLSAAGVLHGFSTKAGGVSTVYGGGDAGELNLGFTASDPRENTDENRRRLLEAVYGELRPLVTLHQTHSGLVHRVSTVHASGESALRGDGLMTDEPGLALGIQTADCVPVLVADPVRGAVAAFHAGWRGTLRRIVERGIGQMRLLFGSQPADLRAAVGPCIGACCYRVGDDVEEEFRSQFRYAEELFYEASDLDPIRRKYPMLFLTQRAPGHSDLGPWTHLDLAEANRRQLLDAGLLPDHLEVAGECVHCRAEAYYSYRRDQGFCGRMLATIAPPVGTALDGERA